MSAYQLNDDAFLYVVFTFQLCAVGAGIPILLNELRTSESRRVLNKTSWLLKLLVLCFVGKWLWETYDLVEKQASSDSSDLFDPYRLLHIPNDGSFNTKEIKAAYKKLARKYHPDSVTLDYVSEEKVKKRWLNLVKAHETLTKESKYKNFLLYGDPNGSTAI